MVTVERGQRRGDAATLRRIWRLHFWVGLFAAPTLLLLACTGLIILYTQPLDLLPAPRPHGCLAAESS